MNQAPVVMGSAAGQLMSVMELLCSNEMGEVAEWSACCHTLELGVAAYALGLTQ